jgi:hypothetical protein
MITYWIWWADLLVGVVAIALLRGIIWENLVHHVKAGINYDMGWIN